MDILTGKERPETVTPNMIAILWSCECEGCDSSTVIVIFHSSDDEVISGHTVDPSIRPLWHTEVKISAKNSRYQIILFSLSVTINIVLKMRLIVYGGNAIIHLEFEIPMETPVLSQKRSESTGVMEHYER